MLQTLFWQTLAVCVLIIAANDRSRYLSRRQTLKNLLYLPFCSYDEHIITSDKKLTDEIINSDYVFSGKVISDVEIHETNATISFTVFVKRFFKSSQVLKNSKELKVIKKLDHGEGTECRQVVRYRYTAIFVGRKPEGSKDVDVMLSISPITVTLQNLDRVNKAVKKG